jgi:hypothetical protein
MNYQRLIKNNLRKGLKYSEKMLDFEGKALQV